MKKKERKKLIKELRRHFKQWRWMVAWLGWRYTVCFMDTHKDMPEESGEDGAALIFASWGYLKATIYICLEKCEAMDDLEYLVIHELVHMLIAPIRSDIERNDDLEYCVTSIAKVMLGLGKAKKAI